MESSLKFPFFGKLMEELNAIDPAKYDLPEAEVKEGEDVLGEATEESKKLWTLKEQYLKRHNDLAHEFDTIASDSEKDAVKEDYLKRLAHLRFMVDLLAELFWASIKDSLNIMWNRKIGVRVGWKIVDVPEETSPGHGIVIVSGSRDLLRALMEGD